MNSEAFCLIRFGERCFKNNLLQRKYRTHLSLSGISKPKSKSIAPISKGRGAIWVRKRFLPIVPRNFGERRVFLVGNLPEMFGAAQLIRGALSIGMTRKRLNAKGLELKRFQQLICIFRRRKSKISQQKYGVVVTLRPLPVTKTGRIWPQAAIAAHRTTVAKLGSA